MVALTAYHSHQQLSSSLDGEWSWFWWLGLNFPSVLEGGDSHEIFLIDDCLNFTCLELFGEVHHVFEEDSSLQIDIVSSKVSLSCMVVHPGFGHQFTNGFSQLVFSFIHDIISIGFLQFKVFFDSFVFVFFLFELSSDLWTDVCTFIQEHHELLPVAFFATQLHHDVFQFLTCFPDLVDDVISVSLELIEGYLVPECLDCSC